MGCARNPNWNDLCPLLSAPVKKVAGVFKGQSLIEPIAPLQYEANDAANEGADSAHYSAMPIVIKDSARAPAPIILNLGAVINAPPDAVHLLDFPDLLPRAAMRIQQATQAIFQALSVNPAMLPQQTGRQGAKRNQAEVALEQQVDILTTAEAVTVLEQDIFTPLMGWFVDLDYQHRDRPLTVRAFGTMGIQAQMEEVEPLQNRHRYEFRWWGVEQAKNAAQLQQQISGINVLKGMKQDIEQEGYRVRLWPLIESMAMSMFGPRQGALVIEDARHQSTLPPDVENQLLAENYEVPVQPMDQDIEHIQAHQQAAQQTGDPFGTFRVHLGLHMKQLQQKQEAQAMQAMQQAMQQQQQGGQAGGPGRPGPRPGAQPAPPRPPINAPGAIRPDAMPAAGAVPMPRRM